LNILEKYIKWIRDNSLSNEIRKGVWKLSTPFLDRHNDHLDIYAIQKNEEVIILSDDGYTLNDLKISGFDLNTQKRKEIFDINLKRLGVDFNHKTNEIFTESNIEDLGRKKHNLIQAMLAINDMFCLAQPTISTIFKEDVKIYLKKHKIRFVADIRITGKSGYEHNIDVAIPEDDKYKERIVKSVNNMNRMAITNSIFMFMDIEETRKDIQKIIIYNDEIKYSESNLEALNKYSIVTIPWSKRDKFLDRLSGHQEK